MTIIPTNQQMKKGNTIWVIIDLIKRMLIINSDYMINCLLKD